MTEGNIGTFVGAAAVAVADAMEVPEAGVLRDWLAMGEGIQVPIAVVIELDFDRPQGRAACVYLDYAATTPVAPSVAARMARCLTLEGAFGNPGSASHEYGAFMR